MALQAFQKQNTPSRMAIFHFVFLREADRNLLNNNKSQHLNS